MAGAGIRDEHTLFEDTMQLVDVLEVNEGEHLGGRGGAYGWLA